MADRLSIGQRISAVRRECPYIQKKLKVETYKAVTHDQVTAEVRPYLDKYGLITVTQLLPEHSRTIDTGHRTKAGNITWRFEGVFKVIISCDDNADEGVMFVVPGQGNDTGDKAAVKATSQAVKTALLKAFNIETGENEESNIVTESEPQKLTEAERNGLLAEAARRFTHSGHLGDLRVFIVAALREAQARGDEESVEFLNDKLVAHGLKIKAIAPPEEKPQVAPPKAKETQEPNTPPAAAAERTAEKAGPQANTGAEKPASAGIIKMLRGAIKAQGKDEAEVCARLGVEALEELTKSAAGAELQRLSSGQ